MTEDQVVITMTQDRETKSKIVFTSSSYALGTVYLAKEAHASLGSPTAIRVTIEAS